MQIHIDKLQLEHKHQLELQQKQSENQLGGDMMNTLISEAMKTPEVKNKFLKVWIQQVIKDGNRFAGR